MKKQKKLGRRLKLNKQTIAQLDQDKVLGGATISCSDPCPCDNTVATEACTYCEETCNTCQGNTCLASCPRSQCPTDCGESCVIPCPCVQPITQI
jgi:hypothetical protein